MVLFKERLRSIIPPHDLQAGRNLVAWEVGASMHIEKTIIGNQRYPVSRTNPSFG